MLTNAPKGTKDIMPDQIYKWQYIENKFAELCSRYGFKEIRTPGFEHTELFRRGVGDTTDIVQKEMYTFNDLGNRSITLRPEGTSPVVRAFCEHKVYADAQPTKLYYSISCNRYEKPQSGRFREFHQFGVETFGSENMMADAEIIAIAWDFIREMGITDVELQINSVGCSECRNGHREALRKFLEPKYDKLCSTCKDRFNTNPMRILDCKSPVDQELVKDAPMMLDYLCDNCREAFEQLKENLDALGIRYTVNPKIVRGLDYYTKTAFEFVTDSIGAQGTICGGGRYDGLVEEIGGPSTPGVGWGMGKERLLLTMEACSSEIPKPEGIDIFIAFMGSDARKIALELLHELRDQGLSAQIDVVGRNFKNQFKLADRLGADRTIIIGEDEVKNNIVKIKNMETGEQAEVPMDNVVGSLL